jgi:hypothetical protein
VREVGGRISKYLIQALLQTWLFRKSCICFVYKVISKKILLLGRKGPTLWTHFLCALVTTFLAGEREDIIDFVSEDLVIYHFQLCTTSKTNQKKCACCVWILRFLSLLSLLVQHFINFNFGRVTNVWSAARTWGFHSCKHNSMSV